MDLEEDTIYAPSIDIFFESVLKNWPQPGAAVLLTGMGIDGAKGLKRLYEKKWYTVVQNKSSCVVFGMPKKAIDLGGACDILELEEISTIYYALFRILIMFKDTNGFNHSFLKKLKTYPISVLLVDDRPFELAEAVGQMLAGKIIWSLIIAVILLTLYR